MSSAETILFGSDPTPGIIAVEAGAEFARLYRRVSGSVVTEDHPLRRWLLTTQKHPFRNATWTELQGDDYRYLAEFPNRDSYENARQVIRDSHAASIAYPSAARQFLTRSGKTLFKDMAFDDPVRMQLDIETLGLSPEPEDNEVFLVAISDNRGFETLIEGNEPSILGQVAACIRERDPDIIEGHNILGFDFPYLAARAKRHRIRLAIGRDGSELGFGAPLNCMIGGFSRPYIPVHIAGRHVIDTLLAVQRFDVSRGELSSHGLKAVAVALGIAEEDREIIPHRHIEAEWRRNPERVKKYALQDVRETASLSALICPSEFYLTQMVPDVYARNATSGTGEKINYLFIREYLRQGRSIPEKQPRGESVPGGYTEVRLTGLIRPIVKCDVESLYPSLMLTRGIKPAGDTLGVFLPALQELTRRRFEAKRKTRETTGRDHAYWDGRQASFKILINSFYGYLAGPFNFNDQSAAAEVTTSGQGIVKRIVEELECNGSRVVEVDTDGVYFQPPDDVDTQEAEVAHIDKIGAALPEGIRLAHDGRYRAMISLKIKNYVLQKYSGETVFRGSALRSRADERFGLDFIAQACEYLLKGEPGKAVELYQTVAHRIEAGQMPIDEFARRERITEKTFTSTAKRRLAKAVGAASIGDYVTVYPKADGTVALANDYDNDEDKQYLLSKLNKFAGRLREAFGSDFDTLFPKPSARLRSEAAGQQTLGLFD